MRVLREPVSWRPRRVAVVLLAGGAMSGSCGNGDSEPRATATPTPTPPEARAPSAPLPPADAPPDETGR